LKDLQLYWENIGVQCYEIGVLDPGNNSWDSICQVCPLNPISEIKRHGKELRKEVCYATGACQGKTAL
jgi:hypothetical protein